MADKKNSIIDTLPSTVTTVPSMLGNNSSDSSSPNTGASRIDEDIQDTVSLVIFLNTSAQAVARQPKFEGIEKLDGLKEANKHLELAQSHANDWLKVHSKAVLSTLQGVISFGRFFNELHSSLIDAAMGLGNETSFDQEQINALVTQLQALQMDVQEQHTAVNKIYNDLMTFQAQVNSDYSNFMTHINKVRSTLDGNKALEESIEKDIKDARKKKEEVSKMTVGKAVLIALSAVTGPGLLVMAMAPEIKELKKLMNQIQSLTGQLTTLNTERGLLTELEDDFTDLTDNLSAVGGALEKLSTSWQIFDNQLAQLVSELQRPQNTLNSLKSSDTPKVVALIVTGKLRTAKTSWDTALKRAETILNSYTVEKYVLPNSK